MSCGAVETVPTGSHLLSYAMRLTLIVLLALPASAQAPAPHAVPFASLGNALELAVAGEARLTIAVAEAPAWLTFAQSIAEVARLDSTNPPLLQSLR